MENNNYNHNHNHNKVKLRTITKAFSPVMFGYVAEDSITHLLDTFAIFK